MWNIQEQEERDYWPDTEARNTYYASMMNRRPDDALKIKQAIADGKFCLVMNGTDYCPHTDAILGAREVLISVHDTQADAYAAAEQYGDCGDDYVSVRCPPSAQPPTVPPSSDDEIPF